MLIFDSHGTKFKKPQDGQMRFLKSMKSPHVRTAGCQLVIKAVITKYHQEVRGGRSEERVGGGAQGGLRKGASEGGRRGYREQEHQDGLVVAHWGGMAGIPSDPPLRPV